MSTISNLSSICHNSNHNSTNLQEIAVSVNLARQRPLAVIEVTQLTTHGGANEESAISENDVTTTTSIVIRDQTSARLLHQLHWGFVEKPATLACYLVVVWRHHGDVIQKKHAVSCSYLYGWRMREGTDTWGGENGVVKWMRNAVWLLMACGKWNFEYFSWWLCSQHSIVSFILDETRFNLRH